MKLTNLALFLVLAALSRSALADIETIKAANNQVGVQYVNTDVDYTEKIDGQTFDTEKGHIPGFGLSVSVMKDLFLGNDYLQASFTRLNGDTHYTGEGVVAYPGFGSLLSNHHAQMTDFVARYGKGFVINDQLMMTPYGEIGHHKWSRALSFGAAGSACTNPCSSGSEVYNNSYLGLGLMGQYTPLDKLVLTGNILIGSTFMSSISGSGIIAVPSLPLPSRGFSPQHLGSDITYKFGLNADYAFTDKIHCNIGVDYVDFKYGKSDLFRAGYVTEFEPDSKTNYTTVKVGIGYAF